MAHTGKRYVKFHRIPLPKPSQTASATPEGVLRERFGHESFRAGQGGIVEAVLSGRDVLCLMPTGGGKSLCFQVPALAMRRTALVISPLVALMRDQVDKLRSLGIRAAALPGAAGIEPAERLEIESAALSGTLELLYVSPEKLANPSFPEFLTACGIGLVAIDEAHCICDWGHDFRPDYLAIAERLECLGDVPRVALTASAGHQARKEIGERLLRPGYSVFASNFDRPNILLAAEQLRDPRPRLSAILRSRRSKGASLVYTRSREGASDTAAWLLDQGVVAAPYHAGMTQEDRSSTQDRFLGGDLQTVVATSAFGMGIDKPDIATVCHLGLPQGLESYYQEIGRAGRDGRESLAWVAWTPAESGHRLRKAAGGDDPVAMRREVARVDGILGYLENPPCRRIALLSRFGGEPSEPCGKCDVCLTGTLLDDGAAVDIAAVLDEISLRPNDYSLSTLTEILMGFPHPNMSAATDITGRFAGQESTRVRRFLRQIVAAGVIELDDRHGTLSLTDAGAERLMTGMPVLLPTAARQEGTIRRERKGRGLPKRLTEEWDRLTTLRDAVAARLGIRAELVASDEDLTGIMATGRMPDGMREEFRLELQGSVPQHRGALPAGDGFDTGLF